MLTEPKHSTLLDYPVYTSIKLFEKDVPIVKNDVNEIVRYGWSTMKQKKNTLIYPVLMFLISMLYSDIYNEIHINERAFA